MLQMILQDPCDSVAHIKQGDTLPVITVGQVSVPRDREQYCICLILGNTLPSQGCMDQTEQSVEELWVVSGHFHHFRENS